jgi:hypothetical protein
MQRSKKAQMLARAVMSLGFGAAIAAAVPARAGLTFDFTYGAGISTLPSAEQTQVQDSMNYIASEYGSDFTNNVTLNITVNYDASVDLAQSSANYMYQGFNYGQVRTALLANTPSDAADLPVTDPTLGVPRAGSNGMYSLTTANAKALGFSTVGNNDNSTSDGTVTFGSGPWTFYPDQSRMAVGDYDFTSALEHEVSEIMGRQSIMSQTPNWGYGTFDLFRYSAAGVRSLDPTTNADGTAVSAYFSLDNGTTNLMAFNDVTGGDIHDWAGGNHDSFDAFGPTNDAEPVTAVDLQVMNAIGWTAVPEPTTLGLLAVGSLVLAGRRRRNAI